MDTVIDRIIANPNPRSSWIKRSVAWGKSLNREAAIDSAKSVFAVLGVGTVLADFGTMRAWMLLPCAACFAGAWWGDYIRHDFTK